MWSIGGIAEESGGAKSRGGSWLSPIGACRWGRPEIVTLLWFLTVPLAADEPYWAAAVRDRVAIRADASWESYETRRLAEGERVEVYLERDGWLGIRPPRNSFSWVPARQLQLTAEPDLAVVADDGVRVWIGTTVENVNKHRWQVELKRGETVLLLGERQFITPSGDVADTWYKIAPPAGEFRWVRQADVRREAAGAGSLPQNPPAPGNSPGNSPGNLRPLPAPPEQETVNSSLPPSDLASAPRRLPNAPGGSPAQRLSNTPAANGQDANAQSANAQGAAPQLPPVPPLPASWKAPATAEEFQSLVQKLNVALSTQVAQPAERWQLGELLAQALALSEEGPTPLSRGQATKLAATIESFVELQARQSQQQSQQQRDPNSLAARTFEGGSTAPPPPINGRYQAVGWLMPLQSSRADAPPYAILDDGGRIVQLITPAPGVKLRKFEKQKVGLIGQPSYIAELKIAHLTAQDAVRLAR